jgi:peptidoglycan/LPS O-acetylase OafA/YrhL
MLKLLFRANTTPAATMSGTGNVSYEARLIADNTIEKKSVSRFLFIDNLRWVMIILVLSMHAAVTYSHLGSWYFMEDTPVSKPEVFAFGTYQAWLQSFFMGFLFFISGYFVPKAYDTKGARKFLKDRGYRLGLPLLFFVFILQPVAIYCIFLFDAPDKAPQFMDLVSHYYTRFRWLGGTGPLWFCEALLIFCVGYTLYRMVTKNSTIKTPAVPRKAQVWLFIAMIAIGSFLVRISWPNGTNFYNLQFCYFTQYIFFFIAGVLAYRGDWLRKIPAGFGNYWGRTALIIGMLLWVGNIAFGGAIQGNVTPYQGGWHWQSLVECCREQLVGVGLSLFLLVWFRERFNQQGPIAKFFSDNAFAVYVFHTPVMIALSKIIISWHLPLLLKFVVLTALTTAVTYALSDLVLRKLPVLKNIL